MTRLEDLTIMLKMVDRTQAAFRSVSGRMQNLRKTFAKLDIIAKTAGASILAIGSSLAGVFAVRAPYIDTLGKTADTLGLSVQQLQAFRREAELSGVGVDVLDKGLAKMNRNIGEALSGTGAASDAFERLGFNASNLSRLNPEEAYIRINEAIANVPTLAERASLAIDIFGKKGAEISRITGDNLRKANDELVEFGIALTRVDAARVEAANDAVFKVRQNFTSLGNLLTVHLSSAIVAFANYVLDVSKSFASAEENSIGFGRTVIRVAGKAIDFFGKFQDGLGLIRIGINLVEQSFANLIQNVLEGYTDLLRKLPGGDKLAEKFGLDGIDDFFKSRVEKTSEDIANIQNDILERYQAGSVSARLERYFNEAEIAARARGEKIAKIAGGGGGLLGDPAIDLPLGPEVGPIGILPNDEAAFLNGLDQQAGRAANDPFGFNESDTPTKSFAEIERENMEAFAESIGEVRDALAASGSAFSSFARLAEVNGSKSFKTFQKLQIAVSTVAGISAQIQALASVDNPTFFQKLAAYARMGAIVASGLAALKSVNIGSSGSTAGSASGAATGAPANAQGGQTQEPQNTEPQRRVTVNIQGNGNYTPEQVEELIQAINDNDSSTQIDSRRIAA